MQIRSSIGILTYQREMIKCMQQKREHILVPQTCVQSAVRKYKNIHARIEITAVSCYFLNILFDQSRAHHTQVYNT